MAFSVIAVSTSVSPLRMEEEATDMFITSAPRRLPASLERGLRAGGGFEEQVDLRAAAQIGRLLLDLPVEFDEFFRKVQKAGDIGNGKAFDPEKMPVAEDEGRFRSGSH